MKGRGWVLVLGWVTMTGMAHAQGEIFRCEQGGRVTWTDRACHANAEPQLVRLPSVVDTKAGLALARQYDARIARERARRDAGYAARAEDWQQQRVKTDRLRSARVTNRVVRGMSPADVRSVMGSPDELQRDDDERGERERWIYVRNDGTRQTVSFSGGEVSAVAGGHARSRKKR